MSVLVLLFVLVGCSVNKNIVTYTIASKSTIGYGVAPQRCLLVREGDEQSWSLFYSRIEGFDYEEGYEYVLNVQKTPVNNPPADVSSIRYTLVNILSKEARDSEGLPEIQERAVF